MKNSMTFGVLGVAIGVVGIACAAYANHRTKKVCEKIEKSVDEISEDITVDVSDKLVNKAIEKAVEREVAETVKMATLKVEESIEKDIEAKVREAVKESYADIKGKVSEEVTAQVAKINIQNLTDEIVEKASNKVMVKFDNNLDSILDKFNTDLHNVSKIYRSIANTMTGKDSGKEMIFKL